MIEKVLTIRSHVVKNKIDEGIVYHYTGDEIPLWMDGPQVFKIINNKYFEKYGL